MQFAGRQSEDTQFEELAECSVDGIAWRVDGRGIGRIVIDRAEQHNTISIRVGETLAKAMHAIADRAPRVVLLTGRGPAFCTGGDIGEFRENADSLDVLVDRILSVLHPAVQRLSQLPAPVVVAINGSVGGAGVGLALCGDFALAAASMKLRTGYAAIGLSPDAGASYFMARRIGAMRARQLFYTSEALDAQRCLDAGIVDAVYPDEQLTAEAEALCNRLAASARASLAAIKQLCEGAHERSLEEHMALEKALLEQNARGADAKEGVVAFIARRSPKFGRS